MAYTPDPLPSFHEARAELGLSGPNFDFFFRNFEIAICEYPWAGQEVPYTDLLVRPTHAAAPDLPPMYVVYRPDHETEVVSFVGLTPAWEFAADHPE